MSASTPMKTATAVKAPAEARLPASGESSGYASMIQTAESSGVRTGLGMGRSEPVLWGWAVKSSPMKPTATIESTSAGIEAIAINENSAVGLVAVVIEQDAVMMPIGPPMVPAPAKPAEKANAETKAKPNPGPGQV